MKNFSIADLATTIKALESRATSHEPRFFTGVSIDSRTTQPGDCFFAITGDNFDGHDYVSEAFAKGAACAVVSKEIEDRGFSDKTILTVDETVKALGDFAAEYRRRNNFKVVAITGSVGKTTVRQIANHVLNQHHRVHQAPKNFNNNIGLPLTLLGTDPEDKIVIAELGSNHPGEIADLSRIAQPDIAVITNVYPAHLAGFGNIQTIMQEKLSIAEGLLNDSILIINYAIAPHPVLPVKILTFGQSDSSDFYARNVSLDGPSSRFTINGTELYLPLPGTGNIENALAAWAICKQFDITISDFAQALATLSPIPMRTELLQIGTLTVLNDCYNANPVSMKNSLDILTNLVSKEKRRPVFICSDMAELGRQSDQLHAELGAVIAQAKVQLLLTIGKSAKITAEAAKDAAKQRLQTKSFTDTLSACNNLEKFIKDYDIILVKGSRAAGLEMVVEKIEELFA